MKTRRMTSLLLCLLALLCPAHGADFFVALDGSNVAPYNSWATAATNIQNAINAAAKGDTVWVTNGVYASGGKALAGDVLTRVLVNKALAVRSMNGPSFTMIQGAWDPSTTNGPLAARCAWLTNGASLSGFTLTGGATAASGLQQASGGGVEGYSTNALVNNCVIRDNIAKYSGGGAYQVSLSNCWLINNTCPVQGSSSGGGAASCGLNNCVLTGNSAATVGGGAVGSLLRNCALTGNSAGQQGGGADNSTLLNCTLTANRVTGSAGGGGGAAGCSLINCIVYGNFFASSSLANQSSCTMSYCCSSPLAIGAGNIQADPQFVGDFHISVTSPCRAAGTNTVVTGTDIDGQPWGSPPSIGCDEWQPEAVIAAQPRATITGFPVGLSLVGLTVAGQEPFTVWWNKDGSLLEDGPHYSSAHTTNLVANNLGPADAGLYFGIVSNAFGMATSAVVQVSLRCVDPASAAPAPPYVDWSTAASTIQDAVDAGAPGDFVLVTNGTFASGGRAMAGDLTNRLVIGKPVVVTSINGPALTSIIGATDPVSTNGPLAVRCAWLSDGALLRGFTLTGGATRSSGDIPTLQCGGGVWATSTNAVVSRCVISNNAAVVGGGGGYSALFDRCRIWLNKAQSGGGVSVGLVVNSLVQSNTAGYGGGVDHATLLNCTIMGNHASGSNGGANQCTAQNCIIYHNTAGTFSITTPSSDGSFPTPGTISYSCISTYYSGPGVITSDPQIVDGLHLTSTSPCIGAASPVYASGTDIDGEPWQNPPSMGCKEFYPADFVGLLAVRLYSLWPAVVAGGQVFLWAQLDGAASRVAWDFGDGTQLTNASQLVDWHGWTNAGNYVVTFTAYNQDNPNGVSTTLPMQVLVPVSPTLLGSTLNGTNFSFSFVGQPGATYVVEQTTNLTAPAVWQTVGILPGNGSPLQAIDRNATDPMRVYRVRTE